MTRENFYPKWDLLEWLEQKVEKWGKAFWSKKFSDEP